MPKQLHFKGYEFVERWREALALAARECAKRKRLKIFFVSFLSDTPAHVVLADNDCSTEVEKKSDYWVGHNSAQKREKTLRVHFGIFKSGVNAWTFFALTESNWRENVLLQLVRSLSPDFSLTYLSSA